MSLRIGFLTERMLLGFGVDLVVHQSALRLQKMGFDVTVFTTRIGDEFSETDYRIVNLSDKVEFSHDIFSLQFMTDAIRFLSQTQVDVWICETPPFYHWLPHLRPPVIMVEHGTPPGKFFNRHLGRHLDAYTKDRYEKIYRAFRPGDGLVSISNYIKSCLPDDVAEKCVTIHNGADHFPRATIEAKAQFRKSIGISESECMVLWVGRMEPENDRQPYKGLKEFLESAPLLVKANPNIKIVGVGRAEPSAKAFLEKAGILPVLNLHNDMMPTCFAAADIFINTSRWEGFNLALAEAQFQGTPVVAYNVCAHPEVVTDGNSGFLVSNHRTFIDAVLKLAADATLRETLGTGARKLSSRYRWDDNVERLRKLIHGCHQYALTQPVSLDVPAQMKKSVKYFFVTARNIYRREGMSVLFREFRGSFKRRLKKVDSSPD